MKFVRWIGMIGFLALDCERARDPSSAAASAPGPIRVMPIVAEPAVASAAAEDVRSPTLVAAQGVIEETCGSCHRSDLQTAVPEALAVFDLWDPGWLAGLDDVQLASVVIRLGDQGVAAPDVAIVGAAIAEVLARRLDSDGERC